MKSELPIRAGVFHSPAQVENAVDELLAAGFDRDSISVVAKERAPSAQTQGDVHKLSASGGHTRRAIPIGAGIGALGTCLVSLLWMSPTQGEGLIVAGAMLAAALVGAIAGGYIGAMMTRGFEPAIADFHDQALDKSQYLVAVNDSESGPPLSTAATVLEHAGAPALSLRTD
ncbi:MAG: hypothetical protein JNN27_00155 [Planctomycetes bacterium]|nr:hypothetical protein [Planctomycetota bacterium]